MQLEERFRGDPLLILADCCHPEGKYTADMKTVTNQELLGTITYNMTVEADLKAHQIKAEGIAIVQRQTFDLSLYLDPDFMAVSSNELVAGEYYGITYDTFSTDLRKIPLLDFIVNDTLLSRWNDSVQNIQALVSREYPQPKIPEVSEGELRKLLLGIVAMPCQIQKADILAGEQALSCTELNYTISGEQIAGVLSSLTGEACEKDSSVIFSFYLYEDALVRFNVSGTAGETPFQYCFDLGQNPLHNPLALTGSYGTAKSMSVTVSTESGESRYAESWDIQTIGEGKERDQSFAFDWNPKTGAMIFRSSQLPAPLNVNFQKTEYGLRLETEDLLSMMRLILQSEKTSKTTSSAASVLTISKGSNIKTPDYKNLDHWSMQDFLTLLAGAGTLLGIRLE